MDDVKISQMPSGKFIGVFADREDDRKVFGPCQDFDELVETMRCWLTGEIDKIVSETLASRR